MNETLNIGHADMVAIAARDMMARVRQAAADQAHFHEGPALRDMVDELAWADRISRLPTPSSALGVQARASTILSEMLRCLVSMGLVIADAQEEAWPGMDDASAVIRSYLRAVLRDSPFLMAPPGHPDMVSPGHPDMVSLEHPDMASLGHPNATTGRWQSTDDGWWHCRQDGLWLSCCNIQHMFVARVAGVFVGQADSPEKAMQVASSHADALFGPASP